MHRGWFVGLLTLVLGLGGLLAYPDPPGDSKKTGGVRVAAASGEAQKALDGYQIPAGYKGSVFAAEPMLANPIAFSIDQKGQAFVAESFRVHAGVTDIRGIMDWLDDDLACRTVADRLAMMRKRTGSRFSQYSGNPDRVRKIVDTDGDGKADSASVFADGFSRAEDGLGAGILARGDSVWYTCIPSLWKLDGANQSPTAVQKQELSTGYGVHIGFIGHDLHGLVMGPDGRIYFSIGDRGLNVNTPQGQLFHPDMGAVLRCWPDGSELEVFATGLRNPQELTFDDDGNLFTGDNNSDGGDQARWVHVVQGGDSGWRIGYQFLENPNPRGPWNSEGIWKPRHLTQPAYVIPPIANIGAGPSGVFYDPGTGLDPAHRGCFFMVDFRGAPGGSGIHSFRLKPKGASFELVERKNFLWNVLATDAEVGPDGALYVLDWVQGWGLTGKGRIYRFAHDSLEKDEAAKTVKTLLAKGFSSASLEEIGQWMETSPDRRVRLEAQFELVRRASVETLGRSARESKTELGKIHAIWGLGQLARQNQAALEVLRSLTRESSNRVLAQLARALGEARDKESAAFLVSLTQNPDPVVVREASLALARLETPLAFPCAVELLKKVDNTDAVLRHAAAVALASTKNESELLGLKTHASAAVRLGAVLALRRLRSEQLTAFFQDTDPAIATEAIRAVYDFPAGEIPGATALEAVASQLEKVATNESILFRALAANNRLGTLKAASALAAFAARKGQPESLRKEALLFLRNWAKPSGRDPVVGLWRPLPERNAEDAIAALTPHWGALLSAEPGIQKAAISTASALGIRSLEPRLRELAGNLQGDRATRLAAIQGLVSLKDKEIPQLARQWIKDQDARIRAAGWTALATQGAGPIQQELIGVAESASPTERQAALAALKSIKSPEVVNLLDRLGQKALSGQLPLSQELELEEALQSQGGPQTGELIQKLLAHRKGLNLEGYEVALEGGDAERGRQLFLYKGELACQRCHKVGDNGGIVGPGLDGIGSKKDRKYLLESIVYPNRHIAQGYETLVVTLQSGKTKSGILKEETSDQLTLVTSDGEIIKIPKSEIDERQRGPSAMPADLIKQLTKRELRDLVEFLAELKESPR